ncbi:unnamed protein product [Lupinus luteus]|uniref:Uncharacterized protein n=1 Tax=Lupinus luteus TaxID=3873 RepID=A0AAV1YAI6_LUPLU
MSYAQRPAPCAQRPGQVWLGQEVVLAKKCGLLGLDGIGLRIGCDRTYDRIGLDRIRYDLSYPILRSIHGHLQLRGNSRSSMEELESKYVNSTDFEVGGKDGWVVPNSKIVLCFDEDKGLSESLKIIQQTTCQGLKCAILAYPKQFHDH